jgi:hypothetical protein
VGVPVTLRRSSTANWQNNDLINGFSTLGGPGVIPPQVQIFFSDMLPYFLNTDIGNPDSLQDIFASGSFLWSSFDGTTNPPVIFPLFPGSDHGVNFNDLVSRVLGGNGP